MTTARTIDYWGIVTRSARIAWNHKFLWFFGFFAAMGSGGGGSGGGSWDGSGRGLYEVRDFFVAHAEILVALIMGFVILWLALLVMHLISKGALLSCVNRADGGEHIRFEEGWSAGVKSFWGLLGISFIALLAFLVVSTVCAIAVAVPMIGGAAGIAVGIFIGAVLFIPYLLFLFLLAFTVIYAEREYVIGSGGVGDALARGWELTKTYFWQSMLMWLVSFASAMAFFISLMIALLAIAIPFILIGVANMVAGLVLGIPVGIVVIILTSSAYAAYDHALWTLMYRELTRPSDEPGGPGAPVNPEGSGGPPVRELPRHLPGHAAISPAGEEAEGGGTVPPPAAGEPEGASDEEV
jgi:hypothetical protein